MTFITYVLILKIKILRELSMFYQMKKKKKNIVEKNMAFLEKKNRVIKVIIYLWKKKTQK